MNDVKQQFEDINLATLQQWVATRSLEAMPEELAVYLEMLDKVYRWHNTMALEGEIIQNLLLHYPNHLKGNREQAKGIYCDAVNYFYMDNSITQEALANVYASHFDKLAIAALKLAENSGDFEKVGKLFKQAAECRGVFADKKEELPEEFYIQRYNVYTNRLEDLGLPTINRSDIISLIDGLPLPAEENLRLKQEADVAPKEILDWKHVQKEQN